MKAELTQAGLYERSDSNALLRRQPPPLAVSGQGTPECFGVHLRRAVQAVLDCLTESFSHASIMTAWKVSCQ